jgi:hypothetical protein
MSKRTARFVTCDHCGCENLRGKDDRGHCSKGNPMIVVSVPTEGGARKYYDFCCGRCLRAFAKNMDKEELR